MDTVQLDKMLVVKIGFSSYIAVSLYRDPSGKVLTEVHSHQYPSMTAVVDTWLALRPELTTFDFLSAELHELLDGNAFFSSLS
jgi:uncharacterized membrane protein (DUF4010 family)